MKVFFVGAGPGDPDLITVKGRSLLQGADIVIHAGSLVSGQHLKHCRKDVQLADSSGLNLDEVAKIYWENRRNSGIVVRLHTGDPCLYGAIQEQMDILSEWDIPYEIVPGVSSFQAASAVLQRQFTLPGVSQTIILTRLEGRTKVPRTESLAALAQSGATMVIYLSVDRTAEIQSLLTPILGHQYPAAVVYKATWPDQIILQSQLGNLAKTVQDAGITRHALVVIGRVLASQYEKSKLYDAAFSHGYRNGHPS